MPVAGDVAEIYVVHLPAIGLDPAEKDKASRVQPDGNPKRAEEDEEHPPLRKFRRIRELLGLGKQPVDDAVPDDHIGSCEQNGQNERERGLGGHRAHKRKRWEEPPQPTNREPPQ